MVQPQIIFLMKLISDIHRYFLYNMLICSLFVCFFFFNTIEVATLAFDEKTILEIKAMITLPFGSNLTRLAVR